MSPPARAANTNAELRCTGHVSGMRRSIAGVRKCDVAHLFLYSKTRRGFHFAVVVHVDVEFQGIGIAFPSNGIFI